MKYEHVYMYADHEVPSVDIVEETGSLTCTECGREVLGVGEDTTDG